jgi:hypothetical protein
MEHVFIMGNIPNFPEYKIFVCELITEQKMRPNNLVLLGEFPASKKNSRSEGGLFNNLLAQQL